MYKNLFFAIAMLLSATFSTQIMANPTINASAVIHSLERGYIVINSGEDISIDISTNQTTTINLYSSRGQLLNSMTFSNQPKIGTKDQQASKTVSIPTKNVKAGTYYLEVISDTNSITYTVIIK